MKYNNLSSGASNIEALTQGTKTSLELNVYETKEQAKTKGPFTKSLVRPKTVWPT